MECVDCDCTVKTMDKLDVAIRALLQRGKHVNRMMDNEKLIREAKRMEEVQQLKKQIPKAPVPSETVTMESTMKNSEKQQSPGNRRIYNKQLKTAESIDFDIPSLVYESSENGLDDSSLRQYTSTSLSIPEKTCPSAMYTKSETTTVTTELTHSTFKKGGKNKNGSNALVFNNTYSVQVDGDIEVLPMKVYVKQRLDDNSLDLYLVFFDKKSDKVMDISMTIHEKQIRDVQFCGKDAKLD
ncbi:hypothetical protein CAEBREN_08429 [Caenorhabditis brenneri]|uniref:Uncharacterized protein n=1 Tax=Caenorhabditis brenneri TaxID=135651 RepID=G0P4W0_CAEBE|nr:hypothetical protein CAEBREN_08429 [Caenorhabditis brenneri]